jgi:hypothetical protein
LNPRLKTRIYPENQVAIIIAVPPIYIYRIDQANYNDGFFKLLELLPGKHTLTLFYEESERKYAVTTHRWSVSDISIDLEAKANKLYLIKNVIETGEKHWLPVVVEYDNCEHFLEAFRELYPKNK